MVVKIETTLFHAKWCGHCVNFFPAWQEYSEKIKLNGGKIGNMSVDAKEFEESKIKNQQVLINGDPIKGYPTIKISIDDNGNHKEYEYKGKRTSADLYYHIKNINK